MKKHRLSRYLFTVLIIALFSLCSCAHYQKNLPLTDIHQNEPYTFDAFNQSQGADETFVILTFSGGGTRAAAFSYGVLAEMNNTKLPGLNKTILDEADIISTVSGGSFTGAYYALFGPRIFADFKEKFLYRNIQKELSLALMNPANWLRLSSPYFSRIDLAAELYDRTIFEASTFKLLSDRKKRPFLIMNATNLYQGSRFEFTGEQFNYIGSDILSYPIARAVTASSAFPFLFSPISLVNYPYPDGYKMPDADKMALKDYWNNKSRYYKALNNTMYADKKGHPYLHLMDGGLADNIGLRAVNDLYLRGGIRKKINSGEIKRLLVIVVNAKNEPQETLDKNESPPGLATVALKTATVSMDNYSFETVESIKKMFADRIGAQMNLDGCQQKLDEHCKDGYKLPALAGGKMKLYVVDISFDNLSDNDEKNFLKHLPTTFHLEKNAVERLISAGRLLLKTHPEFKAFMDEFK
ncbi:MAG: patatin-like phospholipase family protein [Nitrospiraceae bacterium]|nr:MAG: patatin-like phospholipase family protein [Nitrospiraceae bacterium]